MNAGEEAVFGKCLGHLEGAHGVHVGGHHGDTRVRLFRVAERDFSVQVHLKQKDERSTLDNT